MARFDCAAWRPISNNIGGRMSANNGLVLHHAVSNAASLQPLFNKPGFGASAHFYVRQDGYIEQLVDTDTVAWAQGNTTGNATFTSVETQGCVAPPYADPMAEPMVAALGRLYAEGNRRHGWPFQLANSQGAKGFGYHRLWNSTACPCDARLNMRDEILRRAAGAGPGVGATGVTPSESEDKEMLISSTPSGKGYIVVKPDGAVFAYGDAAYHGGANKAGHLSAGDRVTDAAYVTQGSGYWLVAKSGAVFAYGDAAYKGSPNA